MIKQQRYPEKKKRAQKKANNKIKEIEKGHKNWPKTNKRDYLKKKKKRRGNTQKIIIIVCLKKTNKN